MYFVLYIVTVEYVILDDKLIYLAENNNEKHRYYILNTYDKKNVV